MSRKQFFLLLKIAVGCTLLIILYQRINDSEDILRAFRLINWHNIFICLFLLIPNFYIQFLRWRFLLRNYYPEVGNKDTLFSLLFGFTLGFITPGNLGELGRAIFFQKYDRKIITGLNIFDKFANIVTVFSAGLISLNFILFTRTQFPLLLLIFLLILTGITLFFLWLFLFKPVLIYTIILKKFSMFSIKSWGKTLLRGPTHLKKSDIFKVLGFSFLLLITIVIQYHILITAFEKTSIFYSFIAVSAILFTKMILPISFADLGIRESAAVVYFTLFGVTKAAAFNAALLIFIINFFLPAIFGSLVIFKLKPELTLVGPNSKR